MKNYTKKNTTKPNHTKILENSEIIITKDRIKETAAKVGNLTIFKPKR